MNSMKILLFAPCLVFLVAQSASAQECCCGSTSPLILDLEGDGIRTTSLYHPVIFDIDADGELEWVAWTGFELDDGFLWIDRNRNRVVDSGAEFFGNATPLPDGSIACNGFEALAVYDLPEHGGTADGRIDREDAIYSRLKVWVDRNHDAKVSRGEAASLRRLGVRAISLEYQESDEVDGNMNKHRFQGSYERVIVHRGRPLSRSLAVHDVFFETGLSTPSQSESEIFEQGASGQVVEKP